MNRLVKLSPSSVDTFYLCSMRYKWSVLDELPPDDNSDNLFAVLGSALHKASEIQDVFSIKEDELRKSWKILFLSVMVDAKNLSEDDKTMNYQRFMNRGYDLLRNLVRMKKRWYRKYEIVANERKYKFKYENKWLDNVWLSGVIDLVLRDGDGVHVALDWKSAKRMCEDIDDNLQLSFYIYFIHIVFGVSYEDIWGTLAYPVHEEMLFTQRTEEDIQKKMFGKLDAMIQRIAEDDWRKEPKELNDLNRCFFCPYKVTCETQGL